MKSLALMVKREEDLQWVKYPFQVRCFHEEDNNKDRVQLIQDRLSQLLKNYPIERVYYGNEFCEFLLPTVEELTSFFLKASKMGLKVSLLTPIVTDVGVNRLRPLLTFLNREYPGTEIICNDWGVILWLKEEFQKLICISGRLINRMVKDPRFGKQDFLSFFSHEGLKYLQQTNYTVPVYQEVLNKYKIRRIEIDIAPQGIDMEMTSGLIPISVHIPFSYVTSGRYCLPQALPKITENKFSLKYHKCEKKCLDMCIIMSKQIKPINNQLDDQQLWKIELYRKGNTIFYLGSNIEEILKKDIFERIVYQPCL